MEFHQSLLNSRIHAFKRSACRNNQSITINYCALRTSVERLPESLHGERRCREVVSLKQLLIMSNFFEVHAATIGSTNTPTDIITRIGLDLRKANNFSAKKSYL